MAKKAKALTTDTKPAPDEVEMKTLEAVFASDHADKFRPSIAQNADTLRDYIRFIGDKFIAVLGTSNDYEISCSEAEPIASNDDNLHSRSIEVWPKPEIGLSIGANPGFEAVDQLLRKTSTALMKLNLSLEDAMTLVDGVYERIEVECSVIYRFVDDKLFRIEDGKDVYSGGVISRTYATSPREVERTLANLNTVCGLSIVLQKTQLEIEMLGIADQVKEIRQRLFNASRHKPYYKTALELISNGLQREVDWLKERKQIHDATQIVEAEAKMDATPEPDAWNGKKKANKEIGELTEEQAAIFFHYFFEITRVNPDLAAARKIEVIKSVTRWSGNSISNIVYDKKGGGVFRKANGDDYVEFEADMQAVKRLYQKLGLTSVVEMIEDEIEDLGGNL